MSDAETDLDPEDAKLVVLARATRVRAGSAEGAAVRDLDGRTYAAATLTLPTLQVSAVAGCLAMAASSGAKGLEAVVVLGDAPLAGTDLGALRDFAGEGVPVLRADPSGVLVETSAT